MGIHDGHREKMRARFLAAGLDAFADHEALELLLYYAIPRRDTNPIAHTLMERYGSLSAVLEAPAEDLRKVEGIGETRATALYKHFKTWKAIAGASAEALAEVKGMTRPAAQRLYEALHGEEQASCPEEEQ